MLKFINRNTCRYRQTHIKILNILIYKIKDNSTNITTTTNNLNNNNVTTSNNNMIM